MIRFREISLFRIPKKAAGLLLCALALSVPAAAFPLTVSADSEPVIIDDGAGLFSDDEAEALESDAQDTASELEAGIAIVTRDTSQDETGNSFARDYLLSNDCVYGSGSEGVIFYIDMVNREYTVYEYNEEASGYLLTDYEGDQILDDLSVSMQNGDYYRAAEAFLDDLVYYAGVDEGSNYDTAQYNMSGESVHEDTPQISWWLCAIVGLIGSGILTAVLVSSRNNNKRPAATAYEDNGTFRIVGKDDHYLNTTVTRTRIQEPSEYSGGHGGGGHGGGGHGGGGSSFSGGGHGGGHGGSRGF